ncbi:S-adenosyl-L-methionine-dependent methyltransferase [Phycomyces nitens]|nr:S-adenosyl-L-methionine-dependent methyltransferase [Phycomyces nitens]
MSSLGIISYIVLLPILLQYNHTIWVGCLLYCHALGLAYWLSNIFQFPCQKKQNKGEIYGLHHLLFNIDIPPKTFWLNMGLWDNDGISYKDACERLVTKATENIPQAAKRIMDVGYGCGDSCFVLARNENFTVTGITNEASQWNLSQRRLSVDYRHLKSRVNLIHGSADQLNRCLDDEDKFDSIVSIDSAYHYNTRWSFIDEGFKRLVPGGTLSLYDLTLDTRLVETMTPLKRQILGLICKAVEIPLENAVSAEVYTEKLLEIGYENVDIELVDRKRIFGGFSREMESHQKVLGANEITTNLENRIFMKMSIFFFGVLANHAWVQPIFVKASKPLK